MKTILLVMFSVILFGCDGKVYSDKDIAKSVAANKTWPMQVEGLFTIEVSKDSGGVDSHIFGTIYSSDESYIAVYTLDSVLVKNSVVSGARVEATIKPSDLDDNTYDIVSIKTK